MRRLFALLLCLMLALSVFSVPASAETAYRMLYDAELPSLNYLLSSTAVEFRVSANVIDTLIEFDNLGRIQPALAKEWTVSDDGLTYTFKLRDNASWVNGAGEQVANVTAQDFVDAAAYILDGKNAAPTAWILTDIIEGAKAYNAGTTPPEEGKEAAPATEWGAVGVKAIDEYTLEYKLTNPAPYFLSMLDYVCFMPVNKAFMDQQGANFGLGTGNDTILYCGAYTLSTFKPQEKMVFTKNPLYWDAEQVYIDTIDKTFNKEAVTLSPELFQRGEIDEVEGMGTTVAQQWLANPDTANLLRPQKQTGQYTYFYNFNYDPQFDAQYEPANWKLAVNNENFRKSFFFGLDRVKAMTVHEADNPEALLYTTITPPNIMSADDVDYTKTGALAQFDKPAFEPEKALEFKAKAMEELTAAGATFPVKVLMCYNPTTTGWAEECQVVEQQLEALLGLDYIDIIVEAGPATGFLGEIRRSGKYAFMRCNWGLDFADPVNTAEPFRPQDTYCFLRNIEGYRDAAGNLEYYNLIDAAKPVYGDLGARYAAFAEAEAWLIEHAITIPFGSDEGGYWASRMNPFERQHNACGLAMYRYKGVHLMDHPMSTDEFFDAYDAWTAARENAGA